MNYKHLNQFHPCFSVALLAACLVMFSAASWAQAIKVEVRQDTGKYQLFRGGEPYDLKGAGMAQNDLDALAAHGGNSIRTWTTEDGEESTQHLLDRAHELGMTVSLCVYTGSEHHGFDYNDKQAVQQQSERIRQEILKYKDHPALLVWIIGNELNFDYTDPAVYDAVNNLSRMIHELDPNHPTTTTTAGFSEALIQDIQIRAPDLDFISFQLYGQLYNLSSFVKETGLSAPYFITEWGAIGHWETPKTQWGAPIEQNSSEKAATYLRGYNKVIKPFRHQAIGNYVFLWGQKQEKTPTWYGMLLETGEETEVIDTMHFIWTGAWPENRTPKLKSMRLDGKSAGDNIRLKAGESYQAKVSVKDPDHDALSYLWQVKKESDATQVGGAFEDVITNLPGLIDNPKNSNIRISAPLEGGAYRLFVYAFDGQGHAAHANIPFYVSE